jgi:hypothetical protein
MSLIKCSEILVVVGIAGTPVVMNGRHTITLLNGIQAIRIALWKNIMVKKLHPVVKELLIEIEDYCARSGVNRTGFGLKALNDGHFISRVEGGRIPKINTIDKIHNYMNGKTKAAKPWKRSP